jgi:hypothetical protein
MSTTLELSLVGWLTKIGSESDILMELDEDVGL